MAFIEIDNRNISLSPCPEQAEASSLSLPEAIASTPGQDILASMQCAQNELKIITRSVRQAFPESDLQWQVKDLEPDEQDRVQIVHTNYLLRRLACAQKTDFQFRNIDEETFTQASQQAREMLVVWERELPDWKPYSDLAAQLWRSKKIEQANTEVISNRHTLGIGAQAKTTINALVNSIKGDDYTMEIMAEALDLDEKTKKMYTMAKTAIPIHGALLFLQEYAAHATNFATMPLESQVNHTPSVYAAALLVATGYWSSLAYSSHVQGELLKRGLVPTNATAPFWEQFSEKALKNKAIQKAAKLLGPQMYQLAMEAMYLTEVAAFPVSYAASGAAAVGLTWAEIAANKQRIAQYDRFHAYDLIGDSQKTAERYVLEGEKEKPQERYTLSSLPVIDTSLPVVISDPSLYQLIEQEKEPAGVSSHQIGVLDRSPVQIKRNEVLQQNPASNGSISSRKKYTHALFGRQIGAQEMQGIR